MQQSSNNVAYLNYTISLMNYIIHTFSINCGNIIDSKRIADSNIEYQVLGSPGWTCEVNLINYPTVIIF